MIAEVARLELRHALRRPVFWLLALGYAGFALAYISTEILGGALSSAGVSVNSSWAITRMVTHLSYLGLLGSAAFVGHTVIRDFRGGMAELLFATQLRRRDYATGRFLGSAVAALLAFSGVFVGLALGHVVPWADPERLMAFQTGGFAAAFFVFALPNTLIGACILFSLALVTRDPMKTWTGAVAALLAFFISRAFAGAFYATEQGQTIAALVEPFGAYAATAVALDWTPHDRNVLVLWSQDLILWNRFLWLMLGTAAVAVAYAVFRRQPIRSGSAAGNAGRGPASRRRQSGKAATGTRATVLGPMAQWWALTRFELRRVVSAAPFRVIFGLSMVALWIWVSQYGRAYGTGFYPYTADMAAHIHSVLRIPLVAIITFYAADLLWGAHLNRFAPVIEATPVRSGVLLLSRFSALVATVVLVLGGAVLVTLAHQISRGFTAIEPGIHLLYLGVFSLPYFIVMAALALFLQVLAGNRYLGMLLMAGVFLFGEVAEALGITSNLLIPGASLSMHYTPLAGFGHYLEPVAWFRAYWLVLAGLALVAAIRLLPRGEPEEACLRWLRLSFWPPGPVPLVLVFAAVSLGGWIFWNTQVLDPLPGESRANQRALAYERTYGERRDDPRPRVTAVAGDLRLYPETRHFRFEGRITMVNPWDETLDAMLLTAPGGTRLTRARLADVPGSGASRDHDNGVAVFRAPLEPGQTRTIDVALHSEPINGFRNRPERTPVTRDGSLLFHDRFLPTPGYDRGREISDEEDRSALGLPERASGLRDPGDSMGRREPQGAPHGGWWALSLSVEVPGNQSVIAPGRGLGPTPGDERATWHFRTDTRIPPSFAVAAGRYTRQSRTVEGQGGPVRLAVHAMPGHERNAPALLDTMERTLAALESRLGPYPHNRMRLVEVDLGEPNCRIRADTVYCDSSLGFINDPRLDDPRVPSNSLVKIPAAMLTNLYLRSVLLPANQAGASSLTDGPGFYLSQLVWADEASREVETEAIEDLHWHYFTQRTETAQEGTIVDHPEQTWVGAHKHAAVLYGLEDYIGRDNVVEALVEVIDGHRLADAPFPHTSDLVAAIRDRADDEWQSLITDLYERRTLYDLDLESARTEARDDGGYRLGIAGEARKRYLDPDGDADIKPMTTPVEVAVFGALDEDGDAPVLWRRRVTPDDLRSGRIELEFDQQPRAVAIDPNRRLLDPDRTDNRVPVQ